MGIYFIAGRVAESSFYLSHSYFQLPGSLRWRKLSDWRHVFDRFCYGESAESKFDIPIRCAALVLIDIYCCWCGTHGFCFISCNACLPGYRQGSCAIFRGCVRVLMKWVCECNRCKEAREMCSKYLKLAGVDSRTFTFKMSVTVKCSRM